MSTGKLFIISGASGVGKSTVLKQVMDRRSDLTFSVSATTRPPRPGEKEAESYYFVDRDKFVSMIENDEFLEYDNHANNFYGTPKGQLEEKLTRSNVILDIEPVGAFNVRSKRPDAKLIFIMPPSQEELEKRLRGRGDTSEEQMALRLKRAVWEMEQKDAYDYVVINDQVDACVEKVLNSIAELADEE